jgi:hypothetical protein
VQAAIDVRLTPFSSLARTQTHRANVRVPAGVAALLELDPTLLPAAVDAFVDRDPGDMRACKRMETFPPTTAVYTRVSMTRCQYAALARGERFIVPRVFGDLPPQKSPRYLPAWVGAKLACGMEILLARSASAGTASAWSPDEVCMVRATCVCEARACLRHSCSLHRTQVCRGPEWEACVEMLRTMGYMQVCSLAGGRAGGRAC